MFGFPCPKTAIAMSTLPCLHRLLRWVRDNFDWGGRANRAFPPISPSPSKMFLLHLGDDDPGLGATHWQLSEHLSLCHPSFINTME